MTTQVKLAYSKPDHPCDHKDRPAVRVSMRRFHQGQGFINNPLTGRIYGRNLVPVFRLSCLALLEETIYGMTIFALNCSSIGIH
jgi:hypothetical protein